MGNLRSVAKAIEHVRPTDRVRVTADAAIIARAARVVVPGQGAARDCLHAIDAHGLREPIMTALEQKPFLGICMGMQLLLRWSGENAGTDCLGVYGGEVKRFAVPLLDPDTQAELKVPHMGWNNLQQLRVHPLWNGIEQGARFYFDHSYYCDPEPPEGWVGSSNYGGPFCAAFALDYVFACQFHPEKSGDDGLRLLRNFTAWNP